MRRTESTSSAQVLKKTQPEEFDLVILGGGTGSTIAAWTFAGEGKQVAVVERKYIGGACPNIAGLPSKKIIHNAKNASYFFPSKEIGITHHAKKRTSYFFVGTENWGGWVFRKFLKKAVPLFFF